MSFLCLLAALVPLATAQPQATLLPDSLGRRAPLNLSIPAADPGDTLLLWVFFTDKGFRDGTSLELAWWSLPPDARRSPSPNAQDLPVPAAYVAAVRATGATIRHATRWLNAVSAEVSSSQLSAIVDLPMVAGVRPVARGRRAPLPAPSPGAAAAPAVYPLDYGLSLLQLLPLQVPELHALGLTGSGVLVSLLDSGFRLTHRAFDSMLSSGRLVARWDFVRGDSSVANDTLDRPGQDEHGTEVLSTMAALTPGELVGAAPQAAFVLAKTEDIAIETHAEEDHYVAALEWADSLGAHVLSSSLAYDFGYTMNGTEAIVTIAAGTAAARGLLLVTAMGNSGPLPTSLGAPADAFDILAVGAVDATGLIATFSSRGPAADGRIKPEVVAQGVSVQAVDPSLPDAYVSVSGTSFSTPLTSASAALLVQAHPDWSPSQLREAFMQSGDRSTAPDNTYGWGRFRLLAALDGEPSGALHMRPCTYDAYDSSAWRLWVVAQAEGDRRPVELVGLYERVPGIADSVSFLPLDDTLWGATLPFAGESELRWRLHARDSAGRDSWYPPDPLRRIEMRRLPESLVEDFEWGGLRWLRGGTHQLFWPSAAAAFSGRFALSDSPGGGYPHPCDAWTMTRLPVRVGGDLPWNLEFWTRYQFAAGDSGRVEWKTEEDSAWQVLAVLTGPQSEWVPFSHTLPVETGDSVWLRFRIVADVGVSSDGWYIDQLRLGGTPLQVSEPSAAPHLASPLCEPAPNPFNRATRIGIQLDRPSRARLLVYDVLGRRVRMLWSGDLNAGSWPFEWDGCDDRGQPLASGLYLALLEVNDLAFTRKLMLLK